MNGAQLREEFKDRWELADNTTEPHHVYQLTKYFGKQVDCVLFNQIYSYPDKDSVDVGNLKDSESKPRPVAWMDFLKFGTGTMQKQIVPTEEPIFFHAASKMIITGHHFEFAYIPPTYTMPDEMVGEGFFYKTIVPLMFFKPGRYDTAIGTVTIRLNDCKAHAEQWKEVMKWDFVYSCSHHDPPRVCGPIDNKEVMEGEGGLKGYMERVLKDSGELTGEPDPGQWWPWRSANKLYKVIQSEPSFVQKYGEPPVVPMGGPGYDEIGMKN